ncbi:hypothetical protein RQCS_62550 (plasmid) [Rhodococcus qingshengii]|uniref:NACHT domain-containing protein n=1 Tax=Rhodococcus qingshengii TaxID=334542 RepID=UPI0007E589AD|nr:NACHT domain-containing protein [Rhodococcus qingshengii]BCF86710.1 hypothetical protein RQCS_62550 [Rhodococcus qingshengii]
MIAAAEFVGEVRELNTALRKRRTGGTLSAGENDALQAIREELQEFDGIERELLLDTLHAWRIDATDVTSPGYEATTAWISTILKENTQVESAVGILKTFTHHLASTASACTIPDLWRQLSNGGIDIISDASGAPAQRFTAQRQLLDDYREAVAAVRDTIQPPIGCDLPTLRIEGLMRQIKVTMDAPESDQRSRSYPLMDVTRRLKRYVLYGGPGAGKSTAIDQLAASLASEPDAPVPVVIRLRKLAKKVEHESDVNLRLVLSCADHLANNEDLISIIEERASDGALLVVLDGVDECRTATRRVLAGLKKLLDGHLRDNGVVVTTRPSLLAQVKHLGLPSVELAPPESPQSIPIALIHALAAQHPVNSREIWQATKIRALENVLTDSEQISKIPLLAMTIASLISAEHVSVASSSASILEDSVRFGIETWERHRSAGILIDYDNGLLTPRMLLDAFTAIGHTLARSGPVSVQIAIESVGGMYIESWELGAREANEIATHAVEFWDERMSVFVISELNLIEPRSRQFAELADALWVTKASADAKKDWVTHALADESMVDTALLAIGKDQELAELFLNDETSPERALDWVSTFGTKNDLPTSTVQRCLTKLCDAATAETCGEDHRGVDWEQIDRNAARELRDGPRWPFVLSAARLRCPPEHRTRRDAVTSQAERADERAVATSFAAITDARVDGRTLTDRELDKLRSAFELEIPAHPKPIIDKGRRGHSFRIRSGEPLLSGRIELAGDAIHFVNQFTPDMAKHAEEYASRASMSSGLHRRILSSIETAGFSITRETPLRSLPKYLLEAPDGRHWSAHEMEALGRVATTGSELSATEKWWSTDVLDLVDVLDLGSASAPQMGVEADSEIGKHLTELAVLYCEAAGINPANVAAMVNHARDTSGDTGLKDLMHLGFIKRPPPRQPSLACRKIDLQAAHEKMVHLLCSPADFIARSACELVWDEKSNALSEDLLEHIENDHVSNHFWVCAAASHLSSDPAVVFDKFLSMDRPELTHTTAILVELADKNGELAATRQLRNHSDLTIRIAAGASAESDSEATQWRCTDCSDTNGIEEEDCAHCDTGTRPERKST